MMLIFSKMKTKRKLYEVWKDEDGLWKVQFPKGRWSVKTLNEALRIANHAKRIDESIETH